MTQRLLMSLLLLMLALPAGAQRPDDVVHWRAKAPAAAVKPGATIRIALAADIEPGWHVYAMSQPKDGPRPLVITIPKGTPFSIASAKIEAPLPTIASDPNFNLETQYYEDRFAATIPVVAAREAGGRRHAVPLEVTFQACNNRICLRPATQTLTIGVTVAAETKGRAR